LRFPQKAGYRNVSLPLHGSLFGAALLVFFPSGGSEGQEFRVDLTRENRVSFLSDAPLEDFRGNTDRIDGFAFIPAGVIGSEGEMGESEFYFEVDLASLDTGMGLRNRHMRENYLKTEQYPFASFSGGILSLQELSGGALSVHISGELSIHGVTRNREISCQVSGEGQAEVVEEVSREDGPLAATPQLRVRCAFSVALSDHDIPIPKLMFMKIDELMELEVDFYLQMVSREAR
jgi:hypothetical protein